MFEFRNYDILRILDGEGNVEYGMLLMYPDVSDPTIIYKDGFDRLSEIKDDIIAVARPKYAWELSNWDNSDLWKDRTVYIADKRNRPTDLINKLNMNDIVRVRDGSIGRINCYNNKLYVIFDDSWLSISDYDDKLIAAYDNTDLDIIKIARPKYPHETIRINYEDVLANPDRIVWEEK